MAGEVKRVKGPNAMKDYLTTGRVSKLLGVAPRTVSKWFDKGLFGPNSFKVPDASGSMNGSDRRISLADLASFCARHRIPVPATLTGHALVALHAQPAAVHDAAVRLMEGFTVRDCPTLFHLGMVTAYGCALAVVDLGAEMLRPALAAVKSLASAGVVCAAVAPADASPSVVAAAREAGARACLKDPDPGALAEALWACVRRAGA